MEPNFKLHAFNAGRVAHEARQKLTHVVDGILAEVIEDHAKCGVTWIQMETLRLIVRRTLKSIPWDYVPVGLVDERIENLVCYGYKVTNISVSWGPPNPTQSNEQKQVPLYGDCGGYSH